MQQIRYIFKLLGAFISRFKMIIFSGIILGLIAFLILIVIKPSFIFATREKIGVIGRYTLDELPYSIQYLIGNGLTKIDPEGHAQPDLAKSWTSQDQGKTWIFTLDDEKYWQDGKKVDSESIKYTFSDVTVEIPDQKTIIFKLNNAFSPFPSVVSKPVFKKGLLGSGEWKVTKASLTGNYVQKLILKDSQNNQKIYKFYPTEEKAKTAFKLGQVDILEGIINTETFLEWKTVEIIKDTDMQSIVAVFFNVEDRFLSEKDIRQALAYGTNKQELGTQRAISPISPNSWAFNPQVKQYAFNAERAEELIDNLPGEVKNDISITVSTTPALLSVSEKIISQWKQLGIDAKVQVSLNVPDQYQALVVIFQVPKDPDQYFMWHSTQISTNITHYRNPRIDKLLEDGRQELREEERKKIYWDFQRYLMEDSPAIFLYHPDFFTIKRK